MTLRDELGVRADPEFDIDLPSGWGRHSVDDATLQTMLVGIKQRCMQQHQLQLYAGLKVHLEQAFADMQREGVFAYFCPTDQDPGTLALPASINASIRKADSGQTLDDLARRLIREHGATPLMGDPRTMRFETEAVKRLDTASVVHHSVVYLTPVPGSRRRRALALVAGFARTPDTPSDSQPMEAMRALFDACVSTLRWRPPSEG